MKTTFTLKLRPKNDITEVIAVLPVISHAEPLLDDEPREDERELEGIYVVETTLELLPEQISAALATLRADPRVEYAEFLPPRK